MDTAILKALADDTRLAIVEQLAGRELCICDLASKLDASDALVSHHVKRLREVGLVRTRRIGVWLHCSLEPDAFASLADALSELSQRSRETAENGPACCAPAPSRS